MNGYAQGFADLKNVFIYPQRRWKPRFPGYVGQKQVPYYTRPEDFKVPDYRPAKPNAFQQSFQPNPQPNFQPQFVRHFVPQQFIPQQFVPQQFVQNFRPSNQGNNFVGQPPFNSNVGQQPFNPNYQNGPQYPNGRFIYPPSRQGVPVVNNGRNQWFVPQNIPQNAFPYLEGSGPIPPQGIYGPTTTTQSTAPPLIPSANPRNYQGTFPTQPSVNPELLTTPVDSQSPTDRMQGHTTRGWYNPTSTSSRGSVGPTTFSDKDNTNTTPDMPRLFETRTNPSTNPSPATESSASATPSGTGTTRSSVDEGLTPNAGPEGPVPPPLSTSATSSRPTSLSSESPRSLETATPEYIEDLYDHSEMFVEEAVTETARPTDVAQTSTTYIPRPASPQEYQPPGHLPEDFKHIDVNFLKPNRTSCVGPLCGIDSDKVSLYKPETAEAGHRPTLLISNAAKGDAARLGYIPPPPKPVSEFETVPPEYNNSRHYPGYRPEAPVPQQVTTTSEPFHLEMPTKGPHVFMPPQHFPAPSSPTLTPPIPAYETTSQPSYSPTAKTIPTRAPPEVPIEVTSTAAYTSSEATTTPQYTVPPFETTPRHTETFSEVTTTQPSYTEAPTPYDSETTIPPWSPTYKTVPTRASFETTPSQTSFEAPRTSTPQYGPSTTNYVSIETTSSQVTRVPTSRTSFEQPYRFTSTPSPSYEDKFTPSHASPTPEDKFTSSHAFPTSSEESSVTPPRDSHTSPPRSTETGTTPSRESLSTPSRESLTPPFEGTPTTSRESLTSSSGPPTSPSRESPPTLPGETSTSPSGETKTTPTEFQTPFQGSIPSTHFTPAEFTKETPSGELPTTPPQSHPVETGIVLKSTTVASHVPNRVRGKVHVICKEDGIEFSANTLFPFTGQIFANDRKRVSSCIYNLVDSVNPMVFLPFADCGVKNAGDQKDNRAQYHMQVVMVIQQTDGTSTIQSFMAQCVHQKIHYNKQTLPRRIEEALEELRLVATKLEQKAPLPQVEMKIVVDEHHQHGPEVSEVDIGMPLAVQWKLIPESDAYGFHVKNCIVKDEISGIEHKMIDELGCQITPVFGFVVMSRYVQIFHRPLQISAVVLQSQPPFCPDLITSPSNSILFDAEGAFLKRRRQAGDGETQTVRAALCMGDQCDAPSLDLDKRCFDLYWVAASTGFSFAALIASITIHIAVKVKIARQ
ncbi:hypothetical protein TELCIR_00155 [Teladorsagia circumcincta]|uniref:ZP domain-containing protein n=1 Tax=Teladorsagia circumcincta TaxID=45464 RepID=A0A2G9V5G1_TELCI|nr:hypothetical protein TELCIR_00155 [Teladorsagia circumcincta]